MELAFTPTSDVKMIEGSGSEPTEPHSRSNCHKTGNHVSLRYSCE